jgi:hypothetical protein
MTVLPRASRNFPHPNREPGNKDMGPTGPGTKNNCADKTSSNLPETESRLCLREPVAIYDTKSRR